jgi:hypothetical protein
VSMTVAEAGQIGGLTRWSKVPDRTAATETMRAAGPGQLDYWLARVPSEVTDPATRIKSAECAKRAYFLRIARLSVEARRRKAQGRSQ